MTSTNGLLRFGRRQSRFKVAVTVPADLGFGPYALGAEGTLPSASFADLLGLALGLAPSLALSLAPGLAFSRTPEIHKSAAAEDHAEAGQSYAEAGQDALLLVPHAVGITDANATDGYAKQIMRGLHNN